MLGIPHALLCVARDLADLNIAGAGLRFDGRAAAVDRGGDMMAVKLSLHGEGLLDADGAGASVRVECEFGAGSDVEVDAAGAGFELPVLAGLTVDFDVSGASVSAKASVKASDPDGTGAGLGANVTGGGLMEFDIAGAGLKVGGAVDAAGTDGAGAGIGFEVGAYVLNLNVARA